MLKYTRKIPVRSRIITENDLKDLARVFVEEAKKLEKAKVRLEFHYSGGISESGEDLSCFEKSIYLGKHRLKHVTFAMRDWKNDKGFMIHLYHGSKTESYITIEGDDPDWVNSKVTLFEDIKNSWEIRRFSISVRTEIYRFAFFAFFFGVLPIMMFSPDIPVDIKIDIFPLVIFFFLSWLILIFMVDSVLPNVELAVKPSRLSVYRKVFVTVLLSIVLQSSTTY